MYSPDVRSNLHLHLLAGGPGSTPKSPPFLGVRDPHLTCHCHCQLVSLDPRSARAKWHLHLSKGLSMGTNVTDERQTTDRQTDRATEECVAIGGIACVRAVAVVKMVTTRSLVIAKKIVQRSVVLPVCTILHRVCLSVCPSVCVFFLFLSCLSQNGEPRI